MLRASLPGTGPGSSHPSWRIRRHVSVHRWRTPRRWRLLSIAITIPALIGGVTIASSTLAGAASSVAVQALSVSPAVAVAGQIVTARARVAAGSRQTFQYVVLAVRDGAGHNLDFPGTALWTLGSAPRTYVSSRAFATPGTYTYWFAYEKGGRWTDLTPKRTFTVQAAGAATPVAPPTPASPSPGPAPSATTTAPPTPGPTNGGPVPVGVPGAWTYTFGDDFSGPLALGTTWADKSTAEADGGHGNPGNQQLEWNQAANCATANGILTMTAKPDSITSPSGRHYDWSSCLLSTSPSYAFRYGYLEVRAQLPGPKGFWPAFWTWQTAGNNHWTETDVYEFYSDNHSRLYLTQHSGSGGGTVVTPPFDPTTGFHAYGADIEPDGTRFYVDGRLAYTTAGTSTGLTNIILDNFVYAGIPPAAGTSAAMRVDYVRAWRH